jgi:chaperonin cofactor prefoldin
MSDLEEEHITDDSDNDNSDEEYETVDITDNELYQVGAQFFENEDGDGLADVLTNLTKVQVALVEHVQELTSEQRKQTTLLNNLTKILQKHFKKTDAYFFKLFKKKF